MTTYNFLLLLNNNLDNFKPIIYNLFSFILNKQTTFLFTR